MGKGEARNCGGEGVSARASLGKGFKEDYRLIGLTAPVIDAAALTWRFRSKAIQFASTFSFFVPIVHY